MTTKQKPTPAGDIDLTEAARQITEKAPQDFKTHIAAVNEQSHQRLASLQREGIEIEERLRRGQEEMAHIDVIKRDNFHALSQMREKATSADAAVAHAKEYALISQQMVGDGAPDPRAEAWKQEALEKWQSAQAQAEQAHAKLDDEEQRVTEQNKRQEARLAELFQEREAGEQALADLKQRITAVKQIQERSMREMGEHEHAEILARVEAYQAQIAERQASLREVENDMATFVESALASLAAWPDLRSQIRATAQVNDATARCIAAAIRYIDTLLTDGKDTAEQLSPNSAVLSGYYSWVQILAIPDRELAVYENLRHNPINLRNRREQLAQLLKWYHSQIW